MASGTAADAGSLNSDSIPILDLRLLSQSDLYSLSLCSSTPFDPRLCDDVVVPKIDRSVFNESAGSRKQTYSRLRLAPPSSSSSSALRLRTPHLRAAATAFAKIQTNNSDPENAENSHIVSLLKQLFVADLNPEKLVSVKIDYSDSPPKTQFSSFPPPSQPCAHPTGHKRKRGRPRKEEILANEGALAPGVGVVDVSGVADGFSALNEVFLHENTEDRDREVLNKDGVAVDLVALGTVEHPYREEMRRRTEGLATEEEFLEFLTGLSGEWGSRRKNKRIVDANEFGAALPDGWKLSLSLKKKNGQVWLYCRRYISPSGLHFVSCKGVSSYLLSLHGVQDTSLPKFSQHYETFNDVDKLTPNTGMLQIPDCAVKDDHRKENLVSHASSLAIDSALGNHEMPVAKDGAQEILHCDKCNIAFSRKDEFLQHQSSHEIDGSKNGITDGVIMKDGKYECQFCHEIFGERHRYNGHVCTHVRYEAKISGESLAGNLGASVDPCTVGESVNPSSFGGFPSQKTEMQGLLNSNTAGEKICSLDAKDNEIIGFLKDANGSMGGAGEAIDIVGKTDQCEVADVILSSKSNKSFHEDEKANNCAAEIIDDDFDFHKRRLAGCSPLRVDAAAKIGLKNVDVIKNSLGSRKPEQCEKSKSSFLDSNQHVEECDISNDCTSETVNEVKLDSENFSVNGSTFNFFGIHGDNTSTCGPVVSKLNVVPNANMLPRSQEENTCGKGTIPDLVSKSKVDETYRFGICEKGSYQADDVNKHEEMQSGISSVFPSCNYQEKVPKEYGAGVATSPLKETVEQNCCKSRLVALSGHESLCDLENSDDKVCGRKNKVSDFDNRQTAGNGELTDPSNSSHIELNSYSIMGTLQGTHLGACTGLSSSTNKQFFQEDYMMRIDSGALEEHRHGQPRGVPPSQSGNDPGDHSKLNAIENAGKHELSLSFGDRPTELCANSSRVEQRSYQTDRINIQSVDSYNIQSFVHKTFGDQTNLGTRNSNIPGDLNQGRLFNIHDSTLKAQRLGSNFNAAHPGEQMGTSGQDFMVAFGNSGSQPGDFGTADNSWRTGHENVFQGTFDATARLQIPSSNSFGTFGLTSDKGEDGSFGANKNYNIHTDMLSLGRTEPVEYHFLGEESSNCMPGTSKIFSYTSNVEQPGVDPSFWLGKDALMPYTSHASQVSSFCIWCRNMFVHQQDDFGTQAGAIGGSMCPSCSSRIPSQFNVL